MLYASATTAGHLFAQVCKSLDWRHPVPHGQQTSEVLDVAKEKEFHS
jgi:hypothetical protein